MADRGGAISPFGRDSHCLWRWYRRPDATADFIDVQEAMECVLRTVLPGPDVEPHRLRDRGVWQTHAEPADPRSGVKTSAISELECLSQGGRIHAIAVVKNCNLVEALSRSLNDLNKFFDAENLDILRLGLDRIIDKFSERIGRVLVAAVAHGLNGKIGGNEGVVAISVLVRGHSRRPPN
nr:hypothetical protein [Rhizobium laguerreae]